MHIGTDADIDRHRERREGRRGRWIHCKVIGEMGFLDPRTRSQRKHRPIRVSLARGAIISKEPEDTGRYHHQTHWPFHVKTTRGSCFHSLPTYTHTHPVTLTSSENRMVEDSKWDGHPIIFEVTHGEIMTLHCFFFTDGIFFVTRAESTPQ